MSGKWKKPQKQDQPRFPQNPVELADFNVQRYKAWIDLLGRALTDARAAEDEKAADELVSKIHIAQKRLVEAWFELLLLVDPENESRIVQPTLEETMEIST